MGVNGEVEHLTCRNGMKMNPDWSNGIIEATCNDNLEWELSPSVAYSCVQGTLQNFIMLRQEIGSVKFFSLSHATNGK